MKRKERHPSEMYWLSLTEACQRFTYWGIGNLLVLFLVKHFAYDPRRAGHLFGIYTGMAFLLPAVGGRIADKWNYHMPILIGMIFTAVGALMLATLSKVLIMPALLCVACGGGLFTPSVYSLLGTFYEGRHELREGGFSLYYSTVNIGVLVAMIVLGYLQTKNWCLVFITAAAVQLLGILPYGCAVKRFKEKRPSRAPRAERATFTVHERSRVVVIVVMTVVSALFWMAYNQAGSSMTLFTLRYTDRHVGGFEVPTPWFIAFGTLFLMILAYPLSRLYVFLRRIGSGMSPVMKTSLSLFCMGFCFLVMQRAATYVPAGAESAVLSPYYLIFAFAFMALAELLLAPISLSFVTRISPDRYRGLFTGIWFMCIGVGFWFGGYVSGWIVRIRWDRFFSIFLFTSFIPAVFLLVFEGVMEKMSGLARNNR